MQSAEYLIEINIENRRNEKKYLVFTPMCRQKYVGSLKQSTDKIYRHRVR